jgi:hypothetical protein
VAVLLWSQDQWLGKLPVTPSTKEYGAHYLHIGLHLAKRHSESDDAQCEQGVFEVSHGQRIAVSFKDGRHFPAVEERTERFRHERRPGNIVDISHLREAVTELELRYSSRRTLDDYFIAAPGVTSGCDESALNVPDDPPMGTGTKELSRHTTSLNWFPSGWRGFSVNVPPISAELVPPGVCRLEESGELVALQGRREHYPPSRQTVK